jgi:hypothetical protein
VDKTKALVDKRYFFPIPIKMSRSLLSVVEFVNCPRGEARTLGYILPYQYLKIPGKT